MRTEDLLEAIGGVDDELLERSEKVQIKKDIPWKKWVSLVACLGLIVGGGRILFNGLAMGSGVANDAASADDMATESITDFTDGIDSNMNYGDADFDGNLSVYPITMVAENDAVVMARNILFEAKEEDGELWLRIEEEYIFTNTSNEEQFIKLTQSTDAYNSIGEMEISIPANETEEMRFSQTHVYEERVGIEIMPDTCADVIANFMWEEEVFFISDDITAEQMELEEAYYYFEFALG